MGKHIVEIEFRASEIAEILDKYLAATREMIELIREYASGNAFGPTKAQEYCNKHKIDYSND